MKTKLLKMMVACALLAPTLSYAEDITPPKTMLEEIADLRQKQQLEQARVDMLTVKQRRLELELSNETAGMAEPLPVDSTSFELDGSEQEMNGSGVPGSDPPPANVAQWDAPKTTPDHPVLAEFPGETVSQRSQVNLLEVAGFSDNLKAIIVVDGARKAVRSGDKIRGTDIHVKVVGFDFIEIEENGKSRFIDLASGEEGAPKGNTPMIPASSNSGFEGSGFGGAGFGSDIAQPLPVVE